MPNVRSVIKRRKAVRNVHTITRAMELIAAARLRKAHLRANAALPAEEACLEMLGQFARGQDDLVDDPLLTEGRSPRVDVLVLTSERGLCGGYNSRLLDQARQTVVELRRTGKEVRLGLVGRRGILQSRTVRLGEEFGNAVLHGDMEIEGFEGPWLYELVFALADSFLADRLADRTSAVHVVYNPARAPQVARLLPLELPPAEPQQQCRQYDYLPGRQDVRRVLLPEAVRLRLFRMVLQAAASEQIARMAAMSAASTAAQDMIRDLTYRINRVRQGQITKELAEIIGGAEAME